MSRRFIHLWLPHFATDRLTRPGKPLAGLRAAPLAVVGRSAGGMRVAAVNTAARAAGVTLGLGAADAQAVCPGLHTLPARPAEDADALGALAEWCQRWSPTTATDGEDGIRIDASGCTHLFGGERAMLDDMTARLEGLGFTVRAGMADTPGAAWAVARFGEGKIALCPEGAGRQWLSSFPVAALRLPPDTIATLRKLGVRRVGELLALPRAPLVARFGVLAARRLDQLLGRESEPTVHRPASEPLAARLAFAEPIGRTGDVAAAIARLAGRVCARLETLGLGARRLELRVFRVDGSALAQSVGTAEPAHDPSHLARLFAEGLDRLDAGFGIEAMALTVTAADPFAARQRSLEARPEGTALALLADRLARRLGPGRLWRPAPRATHLPDRLVAKAAPLTPPPPFPPSPPRPVRLTLPVPAEVAEHDGVPAAIGGIPLANVAGPERIAGEWWRGDGGTRDFWRVEDAGGRRLWLFRDHLGRWCAHGTFG